MIGISFEANKGDKKLVKLVQFTLTTLYILTIMFQNLISLH